MAGAKLTKAQERVLRAVLVSPGIVWRGRFDPRGRVYYDRQNVTRSADTLVHLGLMEWQTGDREERYWPYVLTDAGREWLAARDGGDRG